MKITVAFTLLGGLLALSACGSKDATTPSTSTQVYAPAPEQMTSVPQGSTSVLSNVTQSIKAASVKSSSKASGPKTNISVPVESDESYTTAATKAQAHCSQWDVEAGAPFKGTNASGQTVLTYKCL